VVRVIDVFIDRLDISGLGFKVEPADMSDVNYGGRFGVNYPGRFWLVDLFLLRYACFR
jgi:hypothetical protein